MPNRDATDERKAEREPDQVRWTRRDTKVVIAFFLTFAAVSLAVWVLWAWAFTTGMDF